MDTERLQNALDLFERIGYSFIATADAFGVPHLATARRLEWDAREEDLVLSEWFCPGTLMNLESNSKVALVVWDASLDTGYQIVGEVTRITDHAMLDGYAEELDPAEPIAQVERQLRVRVDKVLRFTHAPHSDVEEPVEHVFGR